jgi:hypothetical protein
VNCPTFLQKLFFFNIPFCKSFVARPITANGGLIIGAVVPPPADDWPTTVNEEAISALERKSNAEKRKEPTEKKRTRQVQGLSFVAEEKGHRRGDFMVKADGISCGGGQTVLSSFSSTAYLANMN